MAVHTFHLLDSLLHPAPIALNILGVHSCCSVDKHNAVVDRLVVQVGDIPGNP